MFLKRALVIDCCGRKDFIPEVGVIQGVAFGKRNFNLFDISVCSIFHSRQYNMKNSIVYHIETLRQFSLQQDQKFSIQMGVQ